MTEYVTLILTTKKGVSEFRVEKNIQKLDLYNRELIQISDNLTELLSLQIFRCSNNQLISLPTLPSSLQKLYCSFNLLTILPVLPASLVEINCSLNKLASLPALPSSLLRLSCRYNRLKALPALPSSLLELDCTYNQLASLPPLPSSLQDLDCGENQLTALPDLPASLFQLSCNYNQLALLPDLPSTLVNFNCYQNQLTSLPMSLLQCRNLRHVQYSDNLFEYIPPALQRFLDRRTFNDQTLYSDTQNVHASSIQAGIRQSIYQLISVKPALSADQCLSSLLKDEVVTSKTKELLVEYLNCPDSHSVLGITFQELFTSVWSVIITHPSSTEIKAILNQEINDSECKCFTGRMSRLVNCLNGFDDRVVVTISQPEQINALIILLMTKYEGDELKSHFKKEMSERGYEKEIEEWLVHLSQD